MDDFGKYKPLIADYLRSKGIELKPSGGGRLAFNCIFHEDNSASAFIRDHQAKCFGCDKSFDVLDAVGRLEGISDVIEQKKFLQKQFGLTDEYKPPPTKKQPVKSSNKKESTPILLELQKARCIFTTEKMLEYATKYILKDREGIHITAAWPYLDRKGKVQIVDVRFEEKNGKKHVLTFWYNGHLKASNPPHCFWGLNNITRNKPLLIVEGAKCAQLAYDALGKAFSVTTWSQGTNNVDRVDWSIFSKIEKIIISPDNDDPGLKAASYIQSKLEHAIIVEQPKEVVERFKNKKGHDIEETLSFFGADQTKQFFLSKLNVRKEESPAQSLIEKISSEGTDAFNARLFLKAYDGEYYWVNEKKCWYGWDGTRWADGDAYAWQALNKIVVDTYSQKAGLATGDEKKWLLREMKKGETTGNIVSALRFAANEPAFIKKADDFDSDLFLLNTANGTIDLKTGQLMPWRRSDFITQFIDTEFDESSRSDLWERFISRACGDDKDLLEYVQRVAGYLIQGTVAEKAFFNVYGAPDTGKSVFLKALRRTLGEYCRIVEEATWTANPQNGGNRDDLVKLKGSRVAMTDEISKGKKFNESIIKCVTGDGEITAAAKHEKTITYKPQFKIIITSNVKTHIRHSDTGMWNRLKVIPFSNVIPIDEQDRLLSQKLYEHEHRQAILAWLVEGCIKWQEHGLGKLPAVAQDLLLEYFKEMDPLAIFIEECCEVGQFNNVTKKAMSEEYRFWCMRNHVKKPLGYQSFASALRSRGVSDGKVIHGQRYWQGIKLLDRANLY